jgi:SAM-dependent methyltransferase
MTSRPEPYAEIARLYDLEYAGFTGDVDFYLRSLPPGPVLDLGTGSGRIALPLARSGRRVVGVDRSRAMLDIAAARAQRDGLPLRLVEADISAFELEERFSAALLSFSLLAFLPGPKERAACLEACRRHLAPGGLLVCDLFSPDLAVLAAGGAPRRYLKTFRDPEAPAIVNKFEEIRYERPAAALVCRESYEVHPFDGPPFTLSGELRLAVLFPEELALLIERHGFLVTARYGGYSGEAFTPESPRQIVLAEKDGE